MLPMLEIEGWSPDYLVTIYSSGGVFMYGEILWYFKQKPFMCHLVTAIIDGANKNKSKMKYELPVNYDKLNQRERKAVRLQYIEEQDNLCQYCNKPLDKNPANKVAAADIYWDIFPKGFPNNPIHLHHSHDTGMTIGAVHMRCNAYLWIYEYE